MKLKRRILAAGAAITVAATLGACSGGANPGTAVESLGVRYTEADVTVAADQMEQVLGQEVQRNNVVGLLSVAQPYFSVAEQAGISLESPEVAGTVDEVLEYAGTDPASLTRASRDMLNALVLAQILGPLLQEEPEAVIELESLMAEPNTTINPRYAQFELEVGIVPSGPFGDVVNSSQPG